MLKMIFELLIAPLGLPIAWHWEYLILTLIGAIAFVISFKIIGKLYRLDFISGRMEGSFFHWLIRLIVFASLWAISYGAIMIIQLIIVQWSELLFWLEVILGISAASSVTIFFLKEFRKGKAVKKYARNER